MRQSEFDHAQAAIEQLRRARAEVADEHFTVSSDDGYVTVTVDAAGYPTALEFDPRVFRSPVDSDGIASAVMGCWRAAREQADQRSRDAEEAVRAAVAGANRANLPDRLEVMGRALLGREPGGRNG